MSGDLGIEILDVKDNPEAQLRQRSPKTETLVDVDKGIFVRFGIPEANGVVIVPDNPHIFVADELRVRDKDHRDEPLLIKDVVVIMGHGVRDRSDRWKFVGGQQVSDTVNAYNKYAKREGVPEAEFLVVCNKDKLTEETGIAVEETDIDEGIAYAAGTEVEVAVVIEPNGISRVYVSSEENMFNLDALEISRKIQVVG